MFTTASQAIIPQDCRLSLGSPSNARLVPSIRKEPNPMLTTVTASGGRSPLRLACRPRTVANELDSRPTNAAARPSSLPAGEAAGEKYTRVPAMDSATPAHCPQPGRSFKNISPSRATTTGERFKSRLTVTAGKYAKLTNRAPWVRV